MVSKVPDRRLTMGSPYCTIQSLEWYSEHREQATAPAVSAKQLVVASPT